MNNKKSITNFTLLLCSFLFSTFMVTGCADASNDTTTGSDTSTIESVQAQEDTTITDTASTRPVKGPTSPAQGANK